MTKIISLIQIKGGVGKSTITTNLVGLMESNKKVALIDCDIPQTTAAAWSAIREGKTTAEIAVDHLQLVDLIKRFNEEYDFILIDAPPRIAEITKVSLILSDLCLVPLGASGAEIWATSDLLKIINAAKAHKPEIDVRIIWNKFRASTRSAQELSKVVYEELRLKELNTKLGYRVAYSEALARGMTVIEWNDKAAKAEMLSLGKELQELLKIKFMKD